MSRKPSEWARWSVLVALSLSFHAVHAASCEDVRVVVSGYCSNVHVAFSGGSAYVTSYATGAPENLPLAGTMLGGCPLPDNPTCVFTPLPSNSSSPRNPMSLPPA
jgi:hypothetical protein